MSDSIELYITQSRTVYPEQGNVEIHLYGRTPDGEEEHIRVQQFEPYFYVPQREADFMEPVDHSDLKRVEKDCETPSLFQDELAKIVATNPGGISRLKDQYEKTFEADVVFTARFRIENEIYTGVKVPNRTVTPDDIEAVEVDAPVRYCYYDIEIDDRGTIPVQGGDVIHTDSEIITIVAYDTFLEEYHAFLSLGERHPEEVLPDVVAVEEGDLVKVGDSPGCIDKLHISYDEKSMLKDWFNWVGETNPDLLMAWNNLGFDAPYLIKRSESIGLNAGDMGRGPAPQAQAGQYDPEISGRVCYDLMKAWERMQYSEVSSALDNAASMELGDDAGKIKHEEGIYELWQNNCHKLLEYNGRDVSLMVDIDDSAGIMEDREELKDTVGLDYEQTYEANDFIEMLTRRKLHEWGVAGPTKTPPSGGGDDDYEGALTLEAFEGRERNVTSIDLASLYPMTMWMLNASPETLRRVVADSESITPLDPEEGMAVAPNGALFDRSEDGLFRALVDDALELTRQAGRRRDQYDAGSEMWEYWNQSREARKRIRNGLYGVLGWVWFFLYDEPVAESVTTMAQEVTRTSAEYINENTQGEVVYGDTDSCYISWPDEWSIEKCLIETESVVEELNGDVYPKLATEWGMPAEECRWEIEIEDASKTMFQAGKKKRYAKRVVWKEGMDFDQRLDDDEISIKGFETKRSDSAPLLTNLQKDTLKMIVKDKPKSDIRQRVFEAAQQIERRHPDWDLIGIPGGIGQALDDYDSDTAQVRAAKAGNELFDLGLGKNDKPKRVYLDEKTINHDDRSVRTDVIGFEESNDIEPVADQLYVDVGRMRDVVIKRPMGRILEPLGVDVEAAMTGTRQGAIADYI